MFAHPAFDLDWNLVRTFVAVAKGGSLAAGARSLGITHPTAARHIQMLEEALGVTLFTRSGKGLILNDIGEALQEVTSNMHASAMAVKSQIELLRAAPVPSIRLGVSEILADLLPQLMIMELGNAHSRVDMLVSNDLVNLLQREADMAVRHVRPDQQELLCKRIGELSMGAFASSAYVQERGLLSFDNVTEHRFIDGLSRDYLVRGAAQRGMQIAPEMIAFRSDSLSCQRAAVRAGWGIAVVPLWVAAQEADWVPVLDEKWVIDLDVWLVARPEVRDHPNMKKTFSRLGEALQDQLAEAN